VLVETLSGRAYPSSHAATSFAAARVLRDALPAVPLYALAGAMALSRSYIGVHYPSDVLAGAALGDAVAMLLAPRRFRRSLIDFRGHSPGNASNDSRSGRRLGPGPEGR
jgi:membrane-associated phospholipid phosphatase